MGRFDKKVNKHEPDAPNSLKKLKKKSNSKLNQMESKHGKDGTEKERNLKILGMMQKEKEYHAGAKGSAAAMDSGKMVKKFKQRE